MSIRLLQIVAWTGAILATTLVAAVALGPTRLTWVNNGLRVDYAPTRACAAFLMVVPALVAIRRYRGPVARATLLLIALAASLLAADRLRFRLDMNASGVRERRLRLKTLNWPDVQRVEATPEHVMLHGDHPRRAIEIDTARWRAEDRASLDRLVARRVAETRQ